MTAKEAPRATSPETQALVAVARDIVHRQLLADVGTLAAGDTLSGSALYFRALSSVRQALSAWIRDGRNPVETFRAEEVSARGPSARFADVAHREAERAHGVERGNAVRSALDAYEARLATGFPSTRRESIRGEFVPPEESAPGAAHADLVRDIEAVVGDIEFAASALPVIALEYQPRADGCFLQVTIDVLSVEDHRPMTISRAAIVPWEVVTRNGATYLVEWTRETIAGLFVHEVAERLSFKGRRAFDVHPYQHGSALASRGVR